LRRGHAAKSPDKSGIPLVSRNKSAVEITRREEIPFIYAATRPLEEERKKSGGSRGGVVSRATKCSKLIEVPGHEQ